MTTASLTSIATIDGHYQYAGRAAAYLLVDGEEAAFIDNATRFSVPHLLEALEKTGLSANQVRYLIVTHVHLDHSGGTAELAKHCPEATIICHPRAARHIVDPTRLVASARPIYGEETFDKLYGEIEPVAEDRVRTLEDEATLELGARTLKFLDSPGHASHHFVIQDLATNSMFSGDAFGSCYPQLQGGTRPYINYVCAPPQFDAQAAQATIRRIRDTGVERVYLTHFGCCEIIEQGAEQLIASLDRFDQVATDAAATEFSGTALVDYCAERALDVTIDELRACGLDPQDKETISWATADHIVTSQGLAVLAEQRRKA